jgi:hypothetical protein
VNPIPVSEAQVKAIVDGAFALLESKTQRPFIKEIETVAQSSMDAMMPAIYQFLITKGIVTAPAA